MTNTIFTVHYFSRYKLSVVRDMFEKQKRHKNTGRAVLFGQEQWKILDPDELEGGGIAEPDACVIRGVAVSTLS